ncbi:MAG: hypothetical protein ACM3ZF_06460 [Mycobacterium leprae]
MPHQLGVTIRAAVDPERLSALQDLLEEISEKGPTNDVLPFARLGGVHFARLFILDAADDAVDRTAAPSLVYMSEIDAPLDEHLEDVVNVAGAGLDRLFGHCIGYRDSASTREGRLRWLRDHLVDAAAYYVNTVGRGLSQIRQEAELRQAIEDFLGDPGRELAGATPLQVRAAIQRFVDSRPDLAWARSRPEPPSRGWRAKETAHAVAVPLALLGLSPLLVPALPIWAAVLRWHEKRDVSSAERPTLELLRELADAEDYVAQNPFTAVGTLKPGRFRRITASAVLSIVDYGLRHIYNRGRLTGVDTIHFARWVFIDDKRRLVFASNYDGSLESYMGDFIDKVAWGLNAVFSNGEGYPRTRWLVLDGARQEQAFKNYLHCHQLPTHVWYSAYDTLTARNINDNARLRAGLFAELTPADAESWLALL